MDKRITAAGQPAQLDIRAAGERSIRVTLKPISLKEDFPVNPAVAPRPYPAAALSLREIAGPVRKTIGTLTIDVRPNPLTLTVTTNAGVPVQEVVFEADGNLSFKLDEHPVLGMGEGGPRPQQGSAWRDQPVQFDRRGQLDTMQPRWQADMYGSRNPAAMLLGTGGWGMFVAAPWGQIDLRKADRGVFLPWKPTDADRAPQTERNQQQNLAKGLPPPDAVVPGLYDFFIFDAHDPAKAMKDFSVITGPAAMPPIWALGYMQSHRTLEDEAQMLGIVDTFRKKNIPLDAVIYLGTGFSPQGWNTRQPSFDFHPDVFKRDPKAVIADMHARNVKVVVHMVPWDRDRLPTLHGTIPPRPGEKQDASHIANYWQQHVPLVKTRNRRVLARRRGLVQSLRAHQAPPALLPGAPGHAAKCSPVEPAAQRPSRHRAMGRLGLVGRHRQLVEDARGADRRRPQLLAEHRSVLGLGHRRLLSQQRIDRRAVRAMVSVRRVLRVFPLARPDVVDASSLGMGIERHGPAGEQQHERADSAGGPAQHPAVGDEQSGHRADCEEVRGAAVSAPAVHLYPGVGGPRCRPAVDARDVAALSG